MLNKNDISNLCLAVIKYADGLEAATHVMSVDGLIKVSQPTYLRVGRPLDCIDRGDHGVWFVSTDGPLHRAELTISAAIPSKEINLCDMDAADPRLIACLYEINTLIKIIDSKKQLMAKHFSAVEQLTADNLKRLSGSGNGFN